MTNSDIVKGSALQVWVGAPQGAQGTQGATQCIAFATNHTLNITTNTNEITTKDHGDYPAVLPTTITWEVTCENLYATDSMETLLDYISNRKKVDITFAECNNYSTGSGSTYSYDNVEEGIIETSKTEWTVGKVIAAGKAYVTSYSINAPAGENASISCTFTGCGTLSMNPS